MGSPVYLHVTLKVRAAGYQRFCDGMAKQVPILESHGWKLEGSYGTAVGRLNTVIDIWKLPDANSLGEVLAKVAQRDDYPAFKALLDETVEEEIVTMVDKLPFSP